MLNGIRRIQFFPVGMGYTSIVLSLPSFGLMNIHECPCPRSSSLPTTAALCETLRWGYVCEIWQIVSSENGEYTRKWPFQNRNLFSHKNTCTNIDCSHSWRNRTVRWESCDPRDFRLCDIHCSNLHGWLVLPSPYRKTSWGKHVCMYISRVCTHTQTQMCMCVCMYVCMYVM